MDIIAKFVEKETKKTHEYRRFTAHTDIGELKVSLKDNPLPDACFRYVIEVNKGVESEFEVFTTYFFANRYFEKLKRKYRGK